VKSNITNLYGSGNDAVSTTMRSWFQRPAQVGCLQKEITMLRINASAVAKTASALVLALGLTAGSAWAASVDELVQQIEMTDGYTPELDAQPSQHPAISAQTPEAKDSQGGTPAPDKTAAAAPNANEQWLEKQLESEGN
jgi:hypothetical protein